MIEITKATIFPPYIWYPRFLLKMALSDTAKIVYILLLDRVRISMSHAGWTDSEGIPYVHFTVQQLCKEIGKGETSVKTALKQLREAGLIRCVRQGMTEPSRIYVNLPEGQKSVSQEGRKAAGQESRKTAGQRGGFPTVSKNDKKKIFNKKYSVDEEDVL